MILTLLLIAMAGFVLGALGIELMRAGGLSSRRPWVAFIILSAVAVLAVAIGMALALLTSPLLD